MYLLITSPLLLPNQNTEKASLRRGKRKLIKFFHFWKHFLPISKQAQAMTEQPAFWKAEWQQYYCPSYLCTKRVERIGATAATFGNSFENGWCGVRTVFNLEIFPSANYNTVVPNIYCKLEIKCLLIRNSSSWCFLDPKALFMEFLFMEFQFMRLLFVEFMFMRSWWDPSL